MSKAEIPADCPLRPEDCPLATRLALRARDEHLALALAGARLGTWAWDAAADVCTGSPRCAEIFGIPSFHGSRAELQAFMHPEDLVAALAQFEAANREDRAVTVEHRIIRPDGAVRWVAVLCHPWHDETGRLEGTLGTIEDVTERHEAAIRLQESEQRFRQVIEALPVIVWTGGPDGRNDFVSPQWEAYTGQDLAAHADGGWLDCVHPDDRPGILAQLREAITRGEGLTMEFRLRARDGSYRWFESRSSAVRDREGRIIKWIGTNADIHDARQLRMELAEREERLSEIAAAAPGALLTFQSGADGRPSFPYASAGVQALYGYSPAELGRDASLVFDRVHPDDLPAMWESIAESARQMTPWRQEWRYRHPERGVIWLEGHSRPVACAGGGIRWHGVVSDISERKRLEQQAAASVKDLRDVREALDQHALVAITDPDGTITYANDRFCELAQYTREEIVGQNHRMFRSGVHSPEFYAGMWRTITAGQVWRGEVCNRARDGSLSWLSATIVPFLGPDGKPVQYVAIRTDITQRRRAEEGLRQWADAFRYCAHGISMSDPATNRIIACNPAFAALLGRSEAQVVGSLIAEAYAPKDQPRIPGLLEAADRTGQVSYEAAVRRSDGLLTPVQVDLVTVRDGGGLPLYRIATIQDVGLRKRAEAALQGLTTQLRAVVEASPLAILAVGPDNRVFLWSPAAERLFGWTAAEVVGRPLPIVPEAHREDQEGMLRRVLAGEQVSGYVTQRQTRSGRLVDVSVSLAAMPGFRDGVTGVLAIYLDVTEEVALRAALETSEARFTRMFQDSPVGKVLIRLRDRQVTDANVAYLTLTGLERAAVVGRPFEEATATGTSELRRLVVNEAVATSFPQDIDFPLQRQDGTSIEALVSGQRIRLEGEDYFLAVLQDVTARRRAEAALRESESRFRQLAEGVREVFWLTDLTKGQVVYVSPAYESIWGRSCESLQRAPAEWLEAIHPEDRERIREAAHTRQVAGTYDEEYRIVRPDGTVRWVRDRAFPVADESGRMIRLAGVAEDITERRELEAQLRQTQKMESVGQLAGGVAHDFNNFLTVIGGCTELLLATLPEDGETTELLGEIRHASERAAALTRQLLAFSRREVVEPRLCDLNAIILDLEKMLLRLLGEDIELSTALAPGLPPVKVDPGQWTQVLMNLAVNARDAMPTGGRLRVETRLAPVEPGATPVPGPPRVVLSVSDTGTGMAPEVRARIFEPFFTTKGLGKGTGLGLAVVHGIVTQSGGLIEVDSAPGVGTTFRLQLPPAPEALERAGKGGALMDVRGSETILLVEDEESLRRMAAPALRAQGYTVLLAANGEDALQVLARHGGPVDLLLTDVVMPRMDGRALALVLQPRYPAMKVLYTSGYTDDAIVRRGIQHREVAFLSKPYTPLALLRKIRQVLGRH